jgi:hypothetical protein
VISGGSVDRRIIFAVGAIVLATAAFLVIRGGTNHPEAPFVMGPITDLSRVELVGEELMATVVLERRGDFWWVVRPVEGPASPELIGRYLAVFTRTIGMDEMELDPQRARQYGLDTEELVRISLFSDGREEPALVLNVGRELQVAQTGARRTYVQPVGPSGQEQRIFRAQAAFGDLLRTPVEELRDLQITNTGSERFQELRITHRDGHSVDLLRVDGEWRFEGRESIDVEPRQVQRLTHLLGRLAARGFVDGAPSVWHFEEPTAVIAISGEAAWPGLEVVRWESGGGHRYLARRPGEDLLFELSQADGEVLTWRAEDLRDRRILGVSSAALSELQLPGRFHLQRGTEGWVSTDRRLAVDPERAQALARNVAALRAERWVTGDEVTPSEIDFRRIGPLTIGVDGHRTTLEIGDLVEGTSSRYARYSEQEGIFVLGRAAIERLTPSVETLTLSSENPSHEESP